MPNRRFRLESLALSVAVWAACAAALLPYRGHLGGAGWFAFGPDGKFLASLDKTRTLRLWDPASGELLRMSAYFGGSSYSDVFSPDLSVVLVGGSGSLRDFGSGRLLWTLTEAGPAIDELMPKTAFSPNGKYLSVETRDGAIQIWNVASGALSRTLGPEPCCRGRFSTNPDSCCPDSIAMAPDARTLAAAKGKTIQFWDVASGRPWGSCDVQTLAGKMGIKVDSILGHAFSPAGKYFTARVRAGGTPNQAPHAPPPSREDGEHLLLWDVDSGRLSRSFDVGWFAPVALSPDDKILARSIDAGVELLDPASGRVLRTLGRREGRVERLVFSSDGKFLALAIDGSIELLDVGKGRARTIGPLVWKTVLRRLGDVWVVGILALGCAGLLWLRRRNQALMDNAAGRDLGIPAACHLCSLAGVAAAVLCSRMANLIPPTPGEYGNLIGLPLIAYTLALLLNSVVLELVWLGTKWKWLRALARVFALGPLVLSVLGVFLLPGVLYFYDSSLLGYLVYPAPIMAVLVLFARLYWHAPPRMDIQPLLSGYRFGR